MQPSAAGTLLFLCPRCEQPIQAPPFALGAAGCCPHCGGAVTARDEAGGMDVVFVGAWFGDRRIRDSGVVLMTDLFSLGWDGSPIAITEELMAWVQSRHQAWTPRKFKKAVRRLEAAGYIRIERDAGDRAAPPRVQICKPLPRMKAS